MARTVLIAAGGTGGHLFPGIAVADELVRRDAGTRVVFAGTPRGLESRLVPRAGYALELLPILPLNGVGLLRMLKGLAVLPWGLLRAAGARPAPDARRPSSASAATRAGRSRCWRRSSASAR